MPCKFFMSLAIIKFYVSSMANCFRFRLQKHYKQLHTTLRGMIADDTLVSAAVTVKIQSIGQLVLSRLKGT